MAFHRKGKAVLVLFIAMLLLMAAACSNGKTESKEKDGANNVDLKVIWWGSQSRHDVTMAAFELYKKDHPNYTFESTFTGWDEYYNNKLPALVAARSLPDIIQKDAAYVADYVNRGLLADLSDFDTTGIDPNLLEMGKIDGKLYAIPLGANGYGMVYNKAEVERLGLTAPKVGWTWDDYFQFGADAKAKLEPGKYGIPDSTTDKNYYVNYQLSKGKKNLFINGQFNLDKDTWFEFLGKYAQMRKDGIVPPPEVTTTDKLLDAQFDLLANGTILVKGLHAAQPGAMDGLMPGKIGVVSAPADVEAGGWLRPTFFFSVSQDSKYKQEASDFIYWFLHDIEAGELMGTQRGVPVIQEVVDTILPELSPADLLGKEMVEIIAQDSQPFVVAPAGWAEFETAYVEVTEAVMFNKSTIEEAYEKLMKTVNEIQEATKK